MATRELSIVLGELARNARPRPPRQPDALASRWRAISRIPPVSTDTPGVISLMDGWIRLLERQAAAEERLASR